MMTPKSTKTRKESKIEEFPDIQCHCFLFCDSITVENGKLFVLGGGLEQISPDMFPWRTVIHLALKLVVATRLLREAPIALRIEFVDIEGRRIDLPTIEGSIHMSTELADSSEYLPFTAPFSIEMELTKPGQFAACLYVNDMPTARTFFEVVSPTTSEIPGEDQI